MKLLDIPRGILFVHLIGDAVHSCAGFLPESPESRVQRLGRDQMSDRKELSLRILLGQFGYSVDLCGHSLSKSEPVYVSFRQIRASVPPSLQWVRALLSEALRFPTFTGTYGS